MEDPWTMGVMRVAARVGVAVAVAVGDGIGIGVGVSGSGVEEGRGAGIVAVGMGIGSGVGEATVQATNEQTTIRNNTKGRGGFIFNLRPQFMLVT
jgi:hypothetical protein